MGSLPQGFVDDLKAQADIVQVVQDYVPLKKAGREYKACCPFHDEKTPSFTVSPSKGFYHCFGCGAHGTALGFLMLFFFMFIFALAASSEDVPRVREGTLLVAELSGGMPELVSGDPFAQLLANEPSLDLRSQTSLRRRDLPSGFRVIS